ncbi:MAG: single-stranded DNA-binding protein [Patescibacteria group bacterium]|nr:single-stranded DNA-binding protein [Patescibacteria group bacterium]
MDLNKVMFIGNIVNDPEMRTTQNGQNVTSFRIATNRRWKNQATGEFNEDAQYHNIVAWGKLAEICSQYMKKGMKVYIEGRLNHRTWEDRQGQKRYTSEIVAESAIMLSRKGEYEGASAAAPNPDAVQPEDKISIPSPEQIPTIDIDEDKEEIKVEDIPF